MSHFLRWVCERISRTSLLLVLLAGMYCSLERAARVDLAAELEALSQIHLAEFGRDALVRAYGKALVRHPYDPARSQALLAMGHLCENHDPAHGFVKDEARARKYFRAAIAAAPLGTEPWLEASLVSFGREIWHEPAVAGRQLADLEENFSQVPYYAPDWRRAAAIRVAAARVEYAARYEDLAATISAFKALRQSGEHAYCLLDHFQLHPVWTAEQNGYVALLGKIVYCDLPKSRRRELLRSYGGWRYSLRRDQQHFLDVLEGLEERLTSSEASTTP
jgi:hypothetical protein